MATRWRQALGSTMHCAAGDGIGIITGAVLAALWRFPAWAEFFLEYILGFGFGWTIFQAFAMRDMAGGDYFRSLRQTFLPELLSMNLLMAGMVVTMHSLRPHIPGSANPLNGGFWFLMSMALIVGFILAYPINWWLVEKGLKHGMITLRGSVEPTQHSPSPGHPGSSHGTHPAVSRVSLMGKVAMTILSFASLAVGITVAKWITR